MKSQTESSERFLFAKWRTFHPYHSTRQLRIDNYTLELRVL